MLHSPIAAHPIRQSVHPYASRIMDAKLGVLQSFDRSRDRKASLPSLFDRYIEGWAEADVESIAFSAARSRAISRCSSRKNSRWS